MKKHLIDIQQHWGREQKIQALLPLAKVMSQKYNIPKGICTLDTDDLRAEACQAIVLAVDSYNPVKNDNIVAWTRQRIAWAMQEAIRNNCHSSRTMTQRGEIIKWTPFSHTLDGKNTIVECFPDKFSDLQASDNLINAISDKQDKAKFYQFIRKLPELNQKIILLYIQGNITQKEIALELSIKETKVCQLISKSIALMKKMAEKEL